MLTWIWLLFPFQSTLLIRGATVQEFRASGVYEFQSTLLIRGATAAASASAYKLLRFQSTLLIRGATLDGKARFRVAVISIHAPHTRSDVIVRDCFSTCRDISIHAPHTRSDIYRSQNPRHIPYFNPRSSYEERRNESARLSQFIFQSTLLIRGATAAQPTSLAILSFQSTLLIRGATRCFRLAF